MGASSELNAALEHEAPDPRIRREIRVIRRVERPQHRSASWGCARRAASLVPFEETRNPDLALPYSNGFVTVEISYDALDRYIEKYGDVPLPMRARQRDRRQAHLGQQEQGQGHLRPRDAPARGQHAQPRRAARAHQLPRAARC